MALIKEDGSIVAGANTYVTAAELATYATARGITFTGDTEILLLKAMDYLESLDDRYKGERTTRDQPLSWPRGGAVIEGWSWGSDEIPRQLVTAQLNLAIEIGDGHDPLNPTVDQLPIVKKRVEGAVEVQYANPGQAVKVSKTQQSSTIINTLLKNSGLFAIRA